MTNIELIFVTLFHVHRILAECAVSEGSDCMYGPLQLL